MSEPLVVTPNMKCVSIDMQDASVSTALRELASWIDEQEPLGVLVHQVWFGADCASIAAMVEIDRSKGVEQ